MQYQKKLSCSNKCRLRVRSLGLAGPRITQSCTGQTHPHKVEGRLARDPRRVGCRNRRWPKRRHASLHQVQRPPALQAAAAGAAAAGTAKGPIAVCQRHMCVCARMWRPGVAAGGLAAGCRAPPRVRVKVRVSTWQDAPAWGGSGRRGRRRCCLPGRRLLPLRSPIALLCWHCMPCAAPTYICYAILNSDLHSLKLSPQTNKQAALKAILTMERAVNRKQKCASCARGGHTLYLNRIKASHEAGEPHRPPAVAPAARTAQPPSWGRHLGPSRAARLPRRRRCRLAAAGGPRRSTAHQTDSPGRPPACGLQPSDQLWQGSHLRAYNKLALKVLEVQIRGWKQARQLDLPGHSALLGTCPLHSNIHV